MPPRGQSAVGKPTPVSNALTACRPSQPWSMTTPIGLDEQLPDTASVVIDGGDAEARNDGAMSAARFAKLEVEFRYALKQDDGVLIDIAKAASLGVERYAQFEEEEERCIRPLHAPAEAKRLRTAVQARWRRIVFLGLRQRTASSWRVWRVRSCRTVREILDDFNRRAVNARR